MTNDPNTTREQAQPAAEDAPTATDDPRGPRMASAEEFGPVGARGTSPDLPDELGILRDELQQNRAEIEKLREEIEDAKSESEQAREKFLRARADLENVRRRSAGDVERAREAGLDSAVLNVLNVYDDLNRALQVADESDPTKILPGIRTVRETLERNLGTLDIERVGQVGDAFDPDVHEALTSVAAPEPKAAGKIAEVYQAGFKRGDRLIRPARVVVYAEQD